MHLSIRVTTCIVVAFSLLPLIGAIPSLSWSSPTKWPNALGTYVKAWKVEETTTSFWDRAAAMGPSVQKYADTILHDASGTYASTVSRIADLKLSVTQVTERAKILKETVEELHKKSANDLYDGLAVEMVKLSKEIQDEFPPPNQAEHHFERNHTIATILARVESGVVHAAVEVGIPESEIRFHFEAMEPHIRDIIVIAGDLAEQHPTIAEVLLFSVAGLIIPEAWFLRPIFGLFGFGPAGTLKGSTAAWAQRRFFGGYIPAGSWFSRLQSIGMGKKIGAGIGIGVGAGLGLFAGLFSGCGGR